MATNDDRTGTVAAPAEDDDAMARLSKAFVAWGVALGGVAMLASVFLVWIVSSGASGERDSIRAIENFTGQTLFLISILTLMAAAGIALSVKRVWRSFWCLIALLGGALFIGASLWALIDTNGFVVHAVNAQKYTTMTSVASQVNGVANALDKGTLTVDTGIGVIIGLGGGILAFFGGLLSIFQRREPAS
jgi:hypothetical protein